ncbi:thiosulfohydrolase SoxB [Massilia sp. W12]|uniref:thiosulfohydrolase SoxB n=1 Tax=Massilia sp. W12 TaxID=3126507 RepID=UPI0030D2EB1F
MSRREYLQSLTAGALAGLLPGQSHAADEAQSYDLPRVGNVHFLHFTDCHAQLQPLHYREASYNIGVGQAANRWPHLTGKHLLQAAGIAPRSRAAYALADLDFQENAQRYGKLGGFAHLATLIKRLRAQRPNALLLDGGDTWQGSGPALWTQGEDMAQACLLLGVDAMTAHWEMTLGAKRVQELIQTRLRERIAFIAQNVQTQDFGDPVFASHLWREVNGVPVAVIGQAFPYTPVANPRHLMPDWRFGIEEENLQKLILDLRAKGARVVVLLSHNGMDVDLKLAARVSGLDAILGGHTHDAVPLAIPVANRDGQTLVCNSGSHGKFVGVLDFEVREGKIKRHAWRLLPVFSNLLPPDREMAQLIQTLHAPYAAQLGEVLTRTEGELHRRGNFNGGFDQLILDGLMAARDAEIAFSPGFRWGPSLLAGSPITYGDLMSQTATTYSQVSVNLLSGAEIKGILEDVADNLFNPDPYYQQGGDMVRTGGLTYSIAPLQKMGSRISDLRLHGKPLDASRKYKVASWAGVQGQQGPMIWDVLAPWLREQKTVRVQQPNVPRIIGLQGNQGLPA